MSKFHLLPVKPYVYQFYKKELEQNGRIYRRVVRNTTNINRVREYFEKHRDSKYRLPVEVRCSSLWTMHGYALELEDQFRRMLFDYVFIQNSKGVPAMQAMREFLSFHNITDDQYDINNAYRQWQREKKKKQSPAPEKQKKARVKISPINISGQARQLSLFQS